MLSMTDSDKRYAQSPPGMTEIPRVKNFHFLAAGVEIEGGCDPNNDPVGVCCSAKCAAFNGKPAECQCPFWGEDSRGVDVQFPWEDYPRRTHEHTMDIGPFFIDKDLVTNADYAKFLRSSSYKPRDATFFLKHWHSFLNHSYLPTHLEHLPVVYVSLADARAFCKWNGKRLPHAYEWQLAAQGSDGRVFPWGNKTERNQKRFPRPSKGS